MKQVPFLQWRWSCSVGEIRDRLRRPIGRNERDPPCNGADIWPNGHRACAE